jgi:hypothetical protein
LVICFSIGWQKPRKRSAPCCEERPALGEISSRSFNKMGACAVTSGDGGGHGCARMRRAQKHMIRSGRRSRRRRRRPTHTFLLNGSGATRRGDTRRSDHASRGERAVRTRAIGLLHPHRMQQASQPGRWLGLEVLPARRRACIRPLRSCIQRSPSTAVLPFGPSHDNHHKLRILFQMCAEDRTRILAPSQSESFNWSPGTITTASQLKHSNVRSFVSRPAELMRTSIGARQFGQG